MVKHNIYYYNANVVRGKQSVRFVNAIFLMYVAEYYSIRQSQDVWLEGTFKIILFQGTARAGISSTRQNQWLKSMSCCYRWMKFTNFILNIFKFYFRNVQSCTFHAYFRCSWCETLKYIHDGSWLTLVF